MTIPSPPPWWTLPLNAEARRIAKTVRTLKDARIDAEGLPFFDGVRFPQFENRGVLRVGTGCTFRSVRHVSSFTTAKTGSIEIGAWSYLNDGVNFYSAERIVVGPNCLMADEVIVYDTNFHQVTPERPARTSPVVIGRNVWIGARAILLPGTKIGDHSVIGAGSVVSGAIPPRSVAVGVPARVVKSFDCADDWIRC